MRREDEPPPLVKSFGNRFVLFGLPPGEFHGAVRGEDLADLENQVNAADDEAALRAMGIKP